MQHKSPLFTSTLKQHMFMKGLQSQKKRMQITKNEHICVRWGSTRHPHKCNVLSISPQLFSPAYICPIVHWEDGPFLCVNCGVLKLVKLRGVVDFKTSICVLLLDCTFIFGQKCNKP